MPAGSPWLLMLELNLTSLPPSEMSQVWPLILTEILESLLISNINNTVFRTALATLGMLIRTRTHSCIKESSC